LNSFVFQNRGQADTIDLIDYNSALNTYTVADFVNASAGNTSQSLNVNWNLTAGQTYFMVQFAKNNAVFANFGLALPSDGDIALTRSSVFGRGLGPALVDSSPANAYWADFNTITTTSDVPEPSSWAMLLLGVLSFGGLLRARRGRRMSAI